MSYGDGPGVDTEQLIKELLQESGWGLKELRKAADEGRAPLLENGDHTDDLRVVDFQVHHPNHQTRYVESKGKAEPVYYGIEDEWRHGWEKVQHDDYVEFATSFTDCPVYVFVYEWERGVILRQRVRDLTPVQTEAVDYGDGTMVYFRRDEFDVVTDDVSQFSSGFGQTGLVRDDIDLSPFGLEPGGQAGLTDFTGVGSDD